MNFVVDMNLTERWADLLNQAGISAKHWSSIGDPQADDGVIMAWAVANQAIVLTHDLDFGTLLAMTKASGPSVVLLRCQDTTPETSGAAVLSLVRRYEVELFAGALIVHEEASARVRLLPFS